MKLTNDRARGPEAGATAAPGDFAPTGDATVGGASGIKVDSHRTSRRVLTAVGLTTAGLGAAVLAARGAGLSSITNATTRFPALLPAAVGAAVLGTGMAGVSLAALRPKQQDYAQVVDGSLREAGAAARSLGGDVGIVAAGGGGQRWGLVELPEPVVDARGGSAAQLSNPPIRFAAVSSRDGDTWVRSGDSFRNMGAATAVDARSIDPASSHSVQSLVGTQLAVSGDGTLVVKLGAPLLDGHASSSAGDAAAKLFEQGIDDAVLLDTGHGVLAYAVDGTTGGTLSARGTGVQPVEALTLLTSNSSAPSGSSARDIGAELSSSPLTRPRIDVSKVAIADAGSLTGRRVAAKDGQVATLGPLVSTHKDLDAAVDAGVASGTRTLLARLSDGVAVYQLPGSGSQRLTTALSPDRLAVVEGTKRFSVKDDGAVTFAARTVPFDTKEPLGKVLDSGSISGTATKHFGSYQSRDAAIAAIKGTLDTATPYVLVDSDGPAGSVHAYTITGSGNDSAGPRWDTDLGATTTAAWRNDHVRRSVEELERRPSTWGTDVHHFDHVTERTVRFLDEGTRVSETATSPSREVSRTLTRIDRAFDPNEAIGRSVSFGGQSLTMNSYLQSFNSRYQARSFIDRAAGDPSSFAVLEQENNRGRYHVYSASPNGFGTRWKSSRADPAMGSWTDDRRRSYSETERRSGQYGTDVYHYDVTEYWSERILSEGYGQTTTDRTNKRVNRELRYIDRADPPPPAPRPPSNGGGTSPGDDDGPRRRPGDSTNNGNPSVDDF